MAYISDTARFSILDMIPCDVWEEPEVPDPENYTLLTPYLCIVDEEPADYHGNFYACTFTAALYQGEHVPVSAEYLKTCRLAPEETATPGQQSAEEITPRHRGTAQQPKASARS